MTSATGRIFQNSGSAKNIDEEKQRSPVLSLSRAYRFMDERYRAQCQTWWCYNEKLWLYPVGKNSSVLLKVTILHTSVIRPQILNFNTVMKPEHH